MRTTALLTRVALVVAGALAVVVAGIGGLVLLRPATPAPAAQSAAVSAPTDPATSPSATTAPPSATATTPAAPADTAASASTPASAAPAPTQTVVDENELATVAATTPIPASAPIVSGIFTGARAAAGAYDNPSRGGIRLATGGRGALAGLVFVVDPGHNGVTIGRINARLVPNGAGGRKPCNTSGTSTNGGYAEHAHNWAVGVRLAALLKARGATVILTRPTDRGTGPCVDERAAIGNRAKAALVVSVHADGAASSARGFHIIRSSAMAGGSAVTARSARAAVIARDTFARVTGRPRSTYLGGGTAITPRRDIAGMNLSRVPAIMLEAGNMRNPTEAALLSSGTFQDKEASALAAAAQSFVGR